jgi:glutamate/aspartate transport system permease protein
MPELDWNIFWQQNPDFEQPYWRLLLEGLGWTLAISAAAWLIAMVLGVLVGTLRTLPNRPLAFLAVAYTEVFRNVPLLVQMFLWYFVVPELIPPLKAWVVQADIATAQFAAAVLCLGLFTSARIAEQVRSGIGSLPRGQTYAAQAIGLSLPQRYRHVLLPQALRIIVPPLTNESMNLIKNSSVALTIGLAELTSRAREMGEYTFKYFEAFTAATLVYILVGMMANRIMAHAEKRSAVPGLITAGGGH